MGIDRYEVIVVGGGPGGYVAGIRLGQHGKKALVIEREHLGGVCMNWGCIPSKALIHAGSVRHEVEAFGEVYTGEVPGVNATALQAWKDGIVKKLRGGVAQLLKSNGCAHKMGTVRLTGPNSLTRLDPDGYEEELQFDQLILATGAEVIQIPSFPYSEPFIGYAKDGVSYDPIPEHLVVIGGGVIGSELGMAYAKLGSTVTIVEMMDTILPGTDKDLLRPVNKVMKQLGIKVLTKTAAKGYKPSGEGAEVQVTLPDGSEQSIYADKVLVAVGFKPHTAELGLEALGGVTLDERGWVTVDAQCRTNLPHVFAVGDITGPPLLAHRASRMGEVAADVISGKPAAFDVNAMPLGAFTQPEVAQTGLTEEQAKEQGFKTKVGMFPVTALGRAATMNATEGVIKVLIDETTDVILGVGIACESANDLIAEACLAIEMGALAEDMASTVHAHPTLAEGLMEAALAARDEPVHTVKRRRR